MSPKALFIQELLETRHSRHVHSQLVESTQTHHNRLDLTRAFLHTAQSVQKAKLFGQTQSRCTLSTLTQ